MKAILKTTTFLAMGLCAVAQPIQREKSAVITTNWIVTTNWINPPPTYRLLDGKLHDASQRPWQSLTFDPSHYWNDAHKMFAELRDGRMPIGATLHPAQNERIAPNAKIRLFTLTSVSRGSPIVSTVVSNVPLSASDVLAGGSRGLSRRLAIQAFPRASRTNMNGFTIERIHRQFDFGTPYTAKVPVVSRKAEYFTNLDSTIQNKQR